MSIRPATMHGGGASMHSRPLQGHFKASVENHRSDHDSKGSPRFVREMHVFLGGRPRASEVSFKNHSDFSVAH